MDDVEPPSAVGLCDRSPIGPLPGGDADKVPARMIENADTNAVRILVVLMDFVLSFSGSLCSCACMSHGVCSGK